MMRQTKLLRYRDMNWNEDPNLANIRRRITRTSRRKMVMGYITIVFIVALGVGVIEEATKLVTMLCR
ncbi:MAG: hypothetical protein ACUZ77_01090 [Candidatus Brocadiales bacterium]